MRSLAAALRAARWRRDGRRQLDGRSLVFATVGRTGTWPTFGRALHASEPTFRVSYDACVAAAAQDGVDLSGLLEGRPLPLGAAAVRVGTTQMIAQQIAICDLLADAGIRPDAVAGISGGELSAAYAAGCITREDAIHVATVMLREASRERSGEFLTIAANAAQARDLCIRADPPLSLMGELVPGRAIVFGEPTVIAVHAQRLADEGLLVGRSQTAHGFHCRPGASYPEAFRDALAGVAFAPLGVPAAMAATGTLLHGAVLDAAYWWFMVLHPALWADALLELLRAGPIVVLDLNCRPQMAPWLAAAAQKAGVAVPEVIRITGEGDELAHWRRGRAAVAGRGRVTLAAPAAPPAEHILGSRTFAERPVEQLEALRTHGAVIPLGDGRETLVLGHAQAREVLEAPQRFSSRLISSALDPLGLDPPAHGPPRRALNARLLDEKLAAYVQTARTAAERCIDGLADSHAFDLLRDLVLVVDAEVAGHVLGLDAGQARAAQRAAGDLEVSSDQALARGLAALESVIGVLEPWQRLLWIASTATTKRAITATVLALGTDDQLRARVRSEPSERVALVEEVLRRNPPEAIITRLCVEDTVLGGVSVPAGAVVHVSVMAANRDPLVFEDPDVLRLGRPRRHLTFGAGPHRCPGSRLARAVAVAVLEVLDERLPRWWIAQPRVALRWIVSTSTHGCAELILATGHEPKGEVAAQAG